MLVFADYDNIDQLTRSRGIQHIVQRIVSSVAKLPIASEPRVDVRFYGGWFSGSNLTKLGQAVSAQMGGGFPMRMTLLWSNQSKPVGVIANAQIARGLAASEQVPIHHTFRYRPFSGQLYFRRPDAQSCHSSTSCPLDTVERFIANRRCPTTGCTIEQHHVVQKGEQKLVDTMLVADLIFWASRPNHPVLAVLSSDDDMWPGIRTAATMAQPIIQIHTSKSPQHENYVRRLTAQSYLQTQL